MEKIRPWGSSHFVHFSKHFSGDQIEEEEMFGTRNMHGDDKQIQYLGGKYFTE
jgi:hypothetical protein